MSHVSKINRCLITENQSNQTTSMAMQQLYLQTTNKPTNQQTSNTFPAINGAATYLEDQGSGEPRNGVRGAVQVIISHRIDANICFVGPKWYCLENNKLCKPSVLIGPSD
ncbi:hypothetical protein HJC23_009458 [Cyclotella cryptica]|uniref:Uncharacterized protein n=1 Tax=Cyclotella cryptica TaxID=29204 RepID=A0ABD3Q0T0_9STRA